LLRREVENKVQGMNRYLDKNIIGAAMEDNAGNSVDASAAQWTTAGNIQPDVSEAISLIEEDNYFPHTMVVSPRAHELLLNSLTTQAEVQVVPGVVRDGRVQSYLGLSLVVSNNLPTPNTVLIFAKNKFGVLFEAYPLTTIPPKEDPTNPLIYRAYFYACHGAAIDRPNAICKITNVY